jgi:hypothetical protein
VQPVLTLHLPNGLVVQKVYVEPWRLQSHILYLPLPFPQVYYISKATLKTADKRYSSLKNDYEMTFNNDTQMWLCEETDDLPTISFNFVNIGDLENHEPNSTIGKWVVSLI